MLVSYQVLPHIGCSGTWVLFVEVLAVFNDPDSFFATLQASFEVVVVSAKARGLPDGRPEVSIEENDFRGHIFGSAFLNVLYLCFSFILPHYVTKTYENKGEKN